MKDPCRRAASLPLDEPGRPTNATSIIQDEIDLDQLRNNMNKLMEEEKVLDINTEAVTSGLDDGMAAENGSLGEEVFASNDEFEAYLSSVGGGNQLEEEFDFYDDDYADQIRDLPGQVKAFRDFQLLNIVLIGSHKNGMSFLCRVMVVAHLMMCVRSDHVTG
ncbi:hypothetical protein Tco_1151750 [Tanacetum coccineum]